MSEQDRTEGYPSLTARQHWGKYALGMLTEMAFIIVLTAIGLVLALIGVVIWQ